MRALSNVLFMVLIVSYLKFGLPNILPLRVGIYYSRLHMSPVHSHADLVRESNRRSNSLIIVVGIRKIGADAFVLMPGSRESNLSVETASLLP